MKRNFWFGLFLLGLLFLFIIFFNDKSRSYTPVISFSNNEIKYLNTVLETNKTLPRLFIKPPLELNMNVKYYYSIFNDIDSNAQFIRIDKKIIQTGTVWFDNVSTFYIFDKNNNKYKRVLTSGKAQDNARFPQTTIVSPDKLTIKFYYDVSSPLQCDGYSCKSYWADYYQWDSNTSSFINVNSKYSETYQELAGQYKDLNEKGCDLGDYEKKDLFTLRDVFLSSNTNYCRGSSREELNKFFNIEAKIASYINK